MERPSTQHTLRFASSIALLSLSLFGATPSCRWGNRILNATTDNPSGYYETEAQNLEFCASLKNGATPCATVSATDLPSLVRDRVTNPVRFVVLDSATGSAVFAHYNQDNLQLPVQMSSNEALVTLASTGEDMLMWDAGCTSFSQISLNGKYLRYLKINENGPLGYPVTGRVEANISVVDALNSTTPGACDTSLTQAAACLSDVNQCQGANPAQNTAKQQFLQSIFDPYLNAGVISLNDLPNVEAMGYEVRFE